MEMSIFEFISEKDNHFTKCKQGGERRKTENNTQGKVKWQIRVEVLRKKG